MWYIKYTIYVVAFEGVYIPQYTRGYTLYVKNMELSTGGILYFIRGDSPSMLSQIFCFNY